MNTLEFLRRVLPAEGNYCAIVINDGVARQGFYSTVDELGNAIVKLDGRKHNTYYAISSFQDKSSRKQLNVLCTKTFALDIDCGFDKNGNPTPYLTKKEGYTALVKFVRDTGLPEPMVVSSGNGLHVYWVLNEPLRPAEWKPLANAMKAMIVAHGFELDMAVPADNARVLRAIGTHNARGGEEVKLILDRPPNDLATITSCLKSYIKSTAPNKTHKNDSYPKSVASIVKSKCQQIAWAVDNQDQVSEPMWYNLLGIASVCHDAEDVAKEWSRDHANYDPDETVRKLHQWKAQVTGPTTCTKFENDNVGGCDGCPVRGKIGTPAKLGAQYKEQDTSANAPSDAVVDVPLPKPFTRANGGMYVEIDDSDVPITNFDIYPVSYGRDETLGYEVCRYKWNRQHVGWQDLVLRQGYLADGTYREFVGSIADQGIVLETRRQTEYFQMMLRSYMHELRKQRTMTNLYSSMGWKEDYKLFVLGDVLYRRKPDGSVETESIKLASASQRVGSDMFGSSGTLEKWTHLSEVYGKAKLNAHMFSIGVSLAAPLMSFTGLKGMTVSLYGTTGGGKSLAQLAAQSVWGNPDKLRFQAKYTQNTLFSRFGMYNNLPVTIDEVTMMGDRDVGDFLYWVSQGRDKARLNRNAEEREAKTWATFCIVSTNKPMSSKLIASGLDTDAQMARLLELTVDAHPLFTKSSDAGKKIFTVMSTNYGAVGDVYIKKLMEIGEQGIRAMIDQATEEFRATFNVEFTGQERYWEQVMVLTYLSLKLAHGWELIKFNPEDGMWWALNQIGALRKTVTENHTDGFDLISEYLNEMVSETVRVMHTGDQTSIDYERLPRSGIRVRVDVYRKDRGDLFDTGTVMLDRAHFRKWLSKRGGDYKGIMDTLQNEHADATPKHKKTSLGKHTPIKLPQSYVIGINLSHPRMQGVLDEAEVAYEELTLGQLQAVK